MQPMSDLTALMRIAQSPAGRKLLALLQSESSVDLPALAATAAGNPEEARRQLSRALSSKEAQALLKELETQL